ncbi:uncharacterized protein LOC132711671 [Pantherophis guttatus]|uniref:Uncharacterized protein LOC132711671 n=1 Tax=Pantherophis guttatus TaxID=94885 RepID=A0ABM3ZFI6_PANGU|nr:uncharacterized protein LOC132711671 [Pantherophis guttatus]
MEEPQRFLHNHLQMKDTVCILGTQLLPVYPGIYKQDPILQVYLKIVLLSFGQHPEHPRHQLAHLQPQILGDVAHKGAVLGFLQHRIMELAAPHFPGGVEQKQLQQPLRPDVWSDWRLSPDVMAEAKLSEESLLQATSEGEAVVIPASLESMKTQLSPPSPSAKLQTKKREPDKYPGTVPKASEAEFPFPNQQDVERLDRDQLHCPKHDRNEGPSAPPMYRGELPKSWSFLLT